MDFLITGGAGFIGTNHIRYILSRYPQDRILCVDKLTYAGNYDNIKGSLDDPRFTFAQVDICDRRAVFELFEDHPIDAVINFAAESHVDRSIEEPQVFLQTNIIGTSVLLDAVERFGVKRFHQVSTDEVYGDLPLDRPDLLFREDWSLKPSSPYSSSKASADLIALAYHRTYGTPVTISRCSNNYGPYQFPEKLIPLMIKKAREDSPLPVYGDGKNVRDWLYVEDHCSAVDLIVRNGECGEIYNIGGNNEVSNLDMVRLILKKLSKSESLILETTYLQFNGRTMARLLDLMLLAMAVIGCLTVLGLLDKRKMSCRQIWQWAREDRARLVSSSLVACAVSVFLLAAVCNMQDDLDSKAYSLRQTTNAKLEAIMGYTAADRDSFYFYDSYDLISCSADVFQTYPEGTVLNNESLGSWNVRSPSYYERNKLFGFDSAIDGLLSEESDVYFITASSPKMGMTKTLKDLYNKKLVEVDTIQAPKDLLYVYMVVDDE